MLPQKPHVVNLWASPQKFLNLIGVKLVKPTEIPSKSHGIVHSKLFSLLRLQDACVLEKKMAGSVILEHSTIKMVKMMYS